MTSLMERLLDESLEDVDVAMGLWRTKSAGVFETHAEILRHAAKAERLAERMARIGLDNAGALLRDAYDVGLVSKEEFVTFVGSDPENVAPSPPLSESSKIVGLPNKRELIEELLGHGPILVHIDGRHALAQVPDRFQDDPKLVLRFGYDLTPAIIDLSLDDHGMYGTLTFGGVPTRCVLPWGSVYSVVSESDQKGMVWPDDVPDVVVDALQEHVMDKRSEARAESEADDGGSKSPPPPRGGHLTLVK